MEFLRNYGFDDEALKYLENNVPSKLLELIATQKDLVSRNLDALKEFGLTNLVDIFKKYYDMFLMDNSTFFEVFNKYDREDLIEKITKNAAIIEYL